MIRAVWDVRLRARILTKWPDASLEVEQPSMLAFGGM